MAERDPTLDVQVVELYEGESRVVTFDMTPSVAGARINGVMTATQQSRGLVAGSTALTLGAPYLVVGTRAVVGLLVTAGTAGEEYVVTITAPLDSGETAKEPFVVRGLQVS